VSTIVHLLLAVILTVFLAFQARSLVFVVRYRRARIAARPPRRSDWLWTSIPVLIVLFLAARSWVAVFDLERPPSASAVMRADAGSRAAAPPR